MGRVKNAIIERQQELEEDLSELRQKLADKEAEFLNFEMQEKFGLIWHQIDLIQKRLSGLENKHKIEMIITEKRSPVKMISILGILTAVTIFYYKFRRGC